MESDYIRSSGGNTCVSIWIDGKMRDIIVSPGSIGTWLSTSQPISDEECRSFVRTRLIDVQRAARQKLLETDPSAVSVSL